MRHPRKQPLRVFDHGASRAGLLIEAVMCVGTLSDEELDRVIEDGIAADTEEKRHSDP